MSFVAPPVKPAANERGIVLVAALLFVLLASVLVLTMMVTATGERTQSSNTQTARLSLYAADAGVRAQQQLLANLAKAKMDSCYAAWVAAGSLTSQPIISNPSALFPTGTLAGSNAATSANPAFTADASITFADAGVGTASQSYNYMFTITSSGAQSTTGQRRVQSTGALRLSATRGSFSDYLVLTDQFRMANNGTVWFTSSDVMDGRVHTNDGFKFAFRPVFHDRVTQGGANATFYNNGGTPVVANADDNGTIDTPEFFGGYLRSQALITLPTNAYDPQSFALGLPLTGTAPTTSQINQALTGSATGTPGSKVYVVTDNPGVNGSNVTGGLYIYGTPTVVKVYADTVTDRQYYRVSVGPNHVSIEVDPVANMTRLWNKPNPGGVPDLQFNGMPNGVLFAGSGIPNLSGPDRDISTGNVPPALAINQHVLIASNSDIVIQGDLTDDLYDDKTNVLGIFSGGGAVRIGNGAPDNLNVDAFVMACGATNGEFTVDNWNSGSPRGVMNLRGGVVSKFYGAFYTWDVDGNPVTGYTRNFHYDRRGLIPPVYPTVPNSLTPDTPSARTIAWKEI
jgi:Tfp pilus assembly protein PilX